MYTIQRVGVVNANDAVAPRRFSIIFVGVVLLKALVCPVNFTQGAVGECDILYVNGGSRDSGGRGCPGVGHSWSQAYTSLQDALAVVLPGQQIWVAGATYKPTTDNNRNATFELKSDVAIYGGFAGAESALAERDIAANPTILSGDINTPGNTGDNSYHVVMATDLALPARLDGFIIRDGRANGPGTVSQGAGLYNSDSSLDLVNCTFIANTSTGDGGAVRPFGPNAQTRFYNCRFLGNASGGNSGAIAGFGDTIVLVNCEFSGNSAAARGGVMRLAGGAMVSAINCTFSRNTAGIDGGSFYIVSADLQIDNSIVWGNLPAPIPTEGSPATVSFSDIEHGFGGPNNIDLDPLFADADGADNTFGTLDDDVSLQSASPCIDTASNGAPPADAVDLDGDGDTVELIPLDLVLNPRVVDGNGDANSIVDMGCYEFIPKAPACPADLTNSSGGGPDGTVNVFDLFVLLANWNANGPGADLAAPFDVVDVFDLFVLLGEWGDC